jgi:SPP1 gp7 family putative phage head morphogenesis protein
MLRRAVLFDVVWSGAASGRRERMIHLVRNGAVLHDHGVQRRVGDMLARTLAKANILGRVQVLREATRLAHRHFEINATTKYPHPLHPHRQHFSEGNCGAARMWRSFSDDDFTMGISTDLPADDAADYIKALTPVTKELFDGLTAQYRSEAFTLAGAADQRLIEKIRDALAEIIRKGGTSGDFEAAVKQLTTEAGVEELSAFNLDTAFNTAAQKAYSLGRYEQMTDPDVMQALPFWQYWTAGDDRVRPEHRVLHMFAARAEDPVWMKIYPPNGFNCRCAVVPILGEEAPEDASDPGLERLPMLAQLLVPQPGFAKVFRV